MNTSETIGKIADALAKAQAEIQNPAKETINPHFKNHYADITAGLNVVRPALTKHGLALVQATRMDGDMLMLDTRIVHSSGEWMESVYPVTKFPAQQQQIGSALTYSRRYALFALVGIAGEDDDDGNEASKDRIPAPPVKREPPRHPPIDDSIPFMDGPAPSVAREYVAEAKKAIADWNGTAEKLKDWWADEQQYRQDAGVTKGTPEYDELHKCFVAKGTALAQRRAA